MKLEELAPHHISAFLRMIEDYQQNDPDLYERFYKRDWSEKEFSKFAKECEKQRMDWRPKAGATSVTRYVMTAPDGEILGNGLMRFPLNEITEFDGGNLFCDVPPSLRRKGFGSYCLALMLFEAVRAGLRRVLVTCPEADDISRKVILNNRGLLQDTLPSPHPERRGTLVQRYWIQF